MKQTGIHHSGNRFAGFCVAILLLAGCFVPASGQSVTLLYGDPADDPQNAFDGNVFQVGNQFGDAPVYAILSGGAKSFQIVSPGESLTKTVSSTGYFSIRPTGNIVIDRTKILNFSGPVSGSVIVTVKPLSITTLSANVASEVAPGTELSVSYRTGAGTFPTDLTTGKFKVQLIDVNGNLVGDLLNSTDQYAGGEKAGSSRGGTRFINALLPANTPTGTYRVRVVTQGLNTTVVGSSSTPFTVRNTAPAIGVVDIGTANFCAGSLVSFPFSTTGTFPQGNQFRVRLTDAAGTSSQDLTETSSTSPIRATIPATLAAGRYRFQIISTATSVVSTTSTINVAVLPTMTLSGNASIIAGTTANIQVSFTGTPPWSVDYVDYRPGSSPPYIRSALFSSSPASLTPTLFSTVTYDKSFISSFRDSGCGSSNQISGSATITVSPIQVFTGSLTGTNCPGSTISVPFTTTSPLPTDAVAQVSLSDNTGNFQNSSIIGSGGQTGPISATLPQNLGSGSGYKLKIVFQKPTVQGAVDYNAATVSTTTSLNIARPDAPKTTDFSFCSGTVLSPLTATGSNLTWYADGSTQPLPNAPTPPNDRTSRYFVTQKINGCESAQAAVNVTITQTPPAPTVGDVTLCQGEQGQFTAPFSGALWYSSASGGVGTTQPPALNGQTAGNQTVYVSQTVNGCESGRTAVKAIVYPIPSAPTVQTPAPLCQYASAGPLLATGQNLTWYDQSGKLPDAPDPGNVGIGYQILFG